jgi:hypothetical protein
MRRHDLYRLEGTGDVCAASLFVGLLDDSLDGCERRVKFARVASLHRFNDRGREFTGVVEDAALLVSPPNR